MTGTDLVPSGATRPRNGAPTPRRGATIERVAARASTRATGDLPAYVTDAQVRAMAAAATTTRDRLLVLTLWYSGGRVSEVVEIGRAHV